MANRRAVIVILSRQDTGVESLAVLLEEDYIVYQRRKVEAVKELISDRQVDFIIMNLKTDVEEKMAFISYLKGDEKYRSILVGIISDGVGSELGNRAVTLGANYNFRHPINAPRIKKQIDNDVYTFLNDSIRIREEHFDGVSRALSVLAAMDMGFVSLYVDDGIYTEYVGQNALKILGYNNSKGPSRSRKNVKELIHPSDYDNFVDVLTSIVDSENTHRLVLRVRTVKWDYQRFELNIKGFTVWEGIKHFSMVIKRSDNDELMSNDLRSEIAIYQENAKIDILTGIYNKETFFLEGSKLIENNPDTVYVVSVWDIDRFKAINEMMGSAMGDRIIIEFADYLKKNLPDDKCLCARIESDHFITMVPLRIHEQYEEKIHQVVYSETKWSTVDNKVYMHVGCYRMEPMDDDIAIACDRAMMALQAIKNSYLARVNYFSREMRDSLLLEQEFVRNAEPAIAGRQFFIMYQPIVDSHTREIVSAEALVRWRKPDGTFISPGVFVPVFEKNGFILRLDLFVWEQVCRFQAERKAEGKRTVPISVNLSRVDFYSETLFEDLKKIQDKYELDSSLMKIEVTESAYMDQPEVILDVVEKFRSAGYKILMDDFGSGFSSFNMLKDFAVDILKIDMRFMDSIDTSERAGNILYSIIQMAKAIHMEIVAEGVETDNQYEMLKNMDCDCIQGYYFYRPLIESDFIEKLDTNEAEISSENIGLYDRILLVTGNPGQAGELFEIMDHQADIHVAGSSAEAEEYLKKSFATLQLILVDYESIPEEFVKIVDFTEEKKFYSDIPLVIIAKTDNIKMTEEYIGRGATDAIRYPFEKNVVKQRLRRLIDFYGMQIEKRTINVLKKSMMLRQQLNSFFEDSIAGIARVILDKDDDYAIKEVSYFNERFLELHGITSEEAVRAETLDALLPNVRYSEVDSFSKTVYAAVERKAQYISKEYDIEKNDGSVMSCLAACSLLYLGSDVKMDFVLLESARGAEERAMDLISAICARANDRMNMRVFRYYFDDDILDRYRRKENGEYARELMFDAEKNLLAEFNVKVDSREYDVVEDMLEKLKSGQEEVSRNLLLSTGAGENAERRWFNLSFSIISGSDGRRCALGIMEDISKGTDLEHLMWTHNQYKKFMEQNSTFYLEADITDNRVRNPEVFEILKAYGLPEGFTYDEFVTVFDMTVEKKDIERVRNRFERATLLRAFNEGKDEQKFTFVSKTLEVPEWREYEALLLMEVNPGNGHLEIGIRLRDTSEQE